MLQSGNLKSDMLTLGHAQPLLTCVLNHCECLVESHVSTPHWIKVYVLSPFSLCSPGAFMNVAQSKRVQKNAIQAYSVCTW